MHKLNVFEKDNGSIDVWYNGKCYQIKDEYKDEIRELLTDPSKSEAVRQPKDPNQLTIDFTS